MSIVTRISNVGMRPFTEKEFFDRFEIGKTYTLKDHIAYNDCECITEWKTMFTGYRKYSGGEMFMVFSDRAFTLQTLFTEYAYQNSDGEWVAFGVLENEQ